MVGVCVDCGMYMVLVYFAESVMSDEYGARQQE